LSGGFYRCNDVLPVPAFRKCWNRTGLDSSMKQSLLSVMARRKGSAGTWRIFAAALAAMVAGPVAAQERPDGYSVFSCTHLPAMTVTQELVATYGDRGEKLVIASDLETFLALVTLDSVAKLRKDEQAYEKVLPAQKVGGKLKAPLHLKYYLGKDETSGKQYLKVMSSVDAVKVMDCTPIQK
jgi:hypothetical protein